MKCVGIRYIGKTIVGDSCTGDPTGSGLAERIVVRTIVSPDGEHEALGEMDITSSVQKYLLVFLTVGRLIKHGGIVITIQNRETVSAAG